MRGLKGFGEALNPRVVRIAMYACAVGVLAGYVAVALLRVIEFITGILFHGQFTFAHWSPVGNHLGIWVIFIPVIGGAVAGVVIRYWEPAIKGHGIPEAMQAVLIQKSRIRKRVAILKPTATAVAIGSGGPFGAEGPIIQTGGAIGSMFGQILHLSAYDRRVLLAAGAGAGMAGTFMAPLTGLAVAIELIVLEFRASSFVPIALACAVADAISVHYRGRAPMFPMPHFTLQSGHELWLFALLGVICGLIAWALTLSLSWLEDHFAAIPWKPVAIWSPMLGAFFLGIIGYFYPRIFGTSYPTIAAILNAKLPTLRMLQLSIAKFWALVISLGAGTTGGVFAPSLVIGGGIGAGYAVLWKHWLPWFTFSSPGLYALAAMGGVFGGIARAPVASVIFMFELSRNAHVVLPLMVCVFIADAFMRLVDENSMMTDKLAKRGLIVTQDYVAPTFQLWNMDVTEIMQPIPADSDMAARLRTGGLLRARAGDSIANTAHRLLEQQAEGALILSRDDPPTTLGLVRIADILALEDERVRRHDLQERQSR